MESWSLLSLRFFDKQVYHSTTRVYAKLLGPCFKTGRIGDQLLHRNTIVNANFHQSTALKSLPNAQVIKQQSTPIDNQSKH